MPGMLGVIESGDLVLGCADLIERNQHDGKREGEQEQDSTERLSIDSVFATSVLFAFGSFLASNVQIGSDFVWFIALLFALAVCTAAATLWRGMRKP